MSAILQLMGKKENVFYSVFLHGVAEPYLQMCVCVCVSAYGGRVWSEKKKSQRLMISHVCVPHKGETFTYFLVYNKRHCDARKAALVIFDVIAQVAG